MSMIQSFWRRMRLGFLIIMFFATAFYLAVTTPWDKYFGHPKSYPTTLAEGQPLVDAIYRFKAERGLWPEYLDDLYPQYLKQRPDPEWNYVVQPNGPSLARHVGPGRIAVGFDFDPASPAWREIDYSDNRVLKHVPLPAPTTLPAAQLAANELAELDRRILADHGAMEQYRAKASFLKSLGKLAETRAVIKQAHAADGNNFWPRLAEAALDLDAANATAPATATSPATAPASAPSLPESFTNFEKWVRANPTFTHLYYLSEAYHFAGQNAAAIPVIAEAAAINPNVAADDTQQPTFYLWDMARFALSQGKYDLVLKLTATWEKMQADGRAEESKEYSYLALAAAAKLAKSDFNGAAADLQTLIDTKRPTWARHRDLLDSAISHKDTAFRYDPGSNPPPYQVFAVPE